MIDEFGNTFSSEAPTTGGVANSYLPIVLILGALFLLFRKSGRR